MRIGVPKETAPHERRVALVPESVSRLVKSGVEVLVERDAGTAAFFPDAAFEAVGAKLASTDDVFGASDVMVKVQRPSFAEVDRLRQGALLVALLQPSASAGLFQKLADRKVSSLSLERVPRITRAQSMDVLSSQATVTGYKAVLLGASHLGKFLPMLTTAAGSLAPAKAFVLGAGVAGLQAIATARRLGAVVSAFDVRAAAREQVQSLGASFVAAELVSQDAEDKGGYAKAQSEDEAQRTLAVVHKHIKDVDLVVTTAQIPGRPAPTLITEPMVRDMKPGSVIVDLAAETGGNCTLTRLGETVTLDGVAIIGPANLASTLPLHASQMFSKNILTLLQHLIKDGSLTVDPKDEITGAMLCTYGGEVVKPAS